MPAILHQKAKSEAAIVIHHVTHPVQHGEGPVWDNRTQMLYFVDTFKATALKYNPNTTKLHAYKIANHNSIGVIFPKSGDPTQFMVGADRDLYDFTWELNSNNGILTKQLQIETDKPKNQINDGKVDVNGSMWIGTLTREPNLTVADNGGTLYRIKMPEMTVEPEVLSTSISNGIAWSGDNKRMFHIDSADKKIYKYNFDRENGTISNKSVLFDIDEYADIQGIPDGMTIDTDDNLWVAVFKGWKILKIDSNSGKLLQTVRMPVEYITSCCWGGPNFDVLYVTTSRLHLGEEEMKQQPLAGALFEITGLGASGTPINLLI